MTFDYIVIGSGPTGSISAKTLVEAGKNVCMIDAGFSNQEYDKITPDQDFISLRKQDKDQHSYFLGKKFEGIPWGEMKAGSQLTPGRKHLVKGVNQWTPLNSRSFKPMESLGYGGLGSAWGTGCHVFSKADFDKMGLGKEDFSTHYNQVAKWIGVSGEMDDAAPYNLQGISEIDEVIQAENATHRIMNRYNTNKKTLNLKGFHLGRTALAAITKDRDIRKAATNFDMDFWTDQRKSAFRPWIMIEELKKASNFQYVGGKLVLSFEEEGDIVKVIAVNISDESKIEYKAKKLIICSGTLGTSRLVLRSAKAFDQQIPVLSNPYCYMPCLQWAGLGKDMEQYKSSLGQLVMFHDPKGNNEDTGMCSLFSYRSLLLHKLVKETPLNFRDGLKLMHFLQSGIIIAGIHHPEYSGPNKWLKLVKSQNSKTGDEIMAEYLYSDAERKQIFLREKKWKWALKKLGLRPLKRIDPGAGSSIHYSGTLPYSKEINKPFSLSPSGLLNGFKQVFIADGSGFKYLPAKGLTLTLMANARRTALNSLENHE